MNKEDIKLMTDLLAHEAKGLSFADDKGNVHTDPEAHTRVIAIQYCFIRLLKNKVGYKDE